MITRPRWACGCRTGARADLEQVLAEIHPRRDGGQYLGSQPVGPLGTGAQVEFLAEKARIRWTVPLPMAARSLATIIDGSMLYWLADRDTEATQSALDALAELFTGWAEPLPS